MTYNITSPSNSQGNQARKLANSYQSTPPAITGQDRKYLVVLHNLFKRGKTDTVAINILSYIIHWYRLQIIKDTANNKPSDSDMTNVFLRTAKTKKM